MSTMLRNAILTLICLVLPTLAWAAVNEQGESKMQIVDAADHKNRVDGDLDTEITNPKLRADSGSKSKFSMSSVFSYTGGAVSKPFAADRPNLSGLPENQVETSVSGTLKIRYRTTKNSSYTVGVGLGLQTPFQGRVNQNENQLNVGDPVGGYNYTFGQFGLQHSIDLLASVASSNESLRVNQIAGPAVNYTVMKAMQNGLHVGVTASSWYNIYGNGPGDNPLWATTGARPDTRTSWVLYLLPTVEYHFNDTYSFRTLFGYTRWRHLYGDPNGSSLLHVKSYQSIGVGIALSRDVFLYPNVQFLPDDIRSDFTNFGISTSVNVF